MLIRTLVLKVINNDRKFLTNRQITDRIAKQIELLITQVCKLKLKQNKKSQIDITRRL